ncbi:hypothetical protein [Streptomyces sp. NPDC002559]
MRNRIRIACRMAAAAVALVATVGTAAPAVAAPTGVATAAAAPAPTGLTYSYDAATGRMTVAWDPKDPADTVTTGYREAFCSGPAVTDGPCFVRTSGPLLTDTSFTFQLAAGRTVHFRLYAENAAYQRAGSAILTLTT